MRHRTRRHQLSWLAAVTTVSACAVLGVACKKTPEPHEAVSVDAAKPPPAPGDASSRLPPSPHVTDTQSCRAIAVRGDATVLLEHATPFHDASAPRPLIDQGFVDQDETIRIPADGGVTIKRARSGRELTFHGKAEAVPCTHGGPIWLGEGVFESVIGPGDGPGRETWLVTPTVVLRWAAARVRVEVAHGGSTRVRANSGSVDVVAPRVAKDGGVSDAIQTIPPNGERVFAGGKTTSVAATARECVRSASARAGLTMRLRASMGKPQLVARFGAQITEAERRTRADCHLAQVAARAHGDLAAESRARHIEVHGPF